MRTPKEGRSSITVTVTFELSVAGQPPPGTRFFGAVAQGQRVDAEAELLDQDGDGLYIGSMQVERGVERGVGIVLRDGRGLSELIKNFGVATFDRNKTFSTILSFRQGSDHF